MRKLKIFYAVSVCLLAALLVLAFFRPVTVAGSSPEVQRVSLLQDRRGWVLQFELCNPTNRDALYSIAVTYNNVSTGEKVRVRAGGTFTYIHHVRRDWSPGGTLRLVVRRAGSPVPVEDVTFHLPAAPGS